MSDLVVAVSAKDHMAGASHAPATLVEYGDYECPSCGEAAGIVKRVQKHFGDRLRFVFRNFPLEMHPHAEAAAETAEFAAAHEKFWEMHDALFAHQRNLADHALQAMVEKQGLDAAEWKKALDEGKYEARVRADMNSGDQSQVSGTPTFFLNGEAYEGSYGFESLVQAIEKASQSEVAKLDPQN